MRVRRLGRVGVESPGVLLDGVVDDDLHRVGMADVGELGGPAHAARLDDEIAGADHALEEVLLEVDAVHPLERDLDTGALEHAAAVDHLVVGDDEVGAQPAHEATDQPAGTDDDRDGHEPRSPRDVPRQHHQDRHDDGDDGDRGRPEEVEPVRLEVDLDDLSAAQQLGRIAHAARA